jgi:hypothetical protein
VAEHRSKLPQGFPDAIQNLDMQESREGAYAHVKVV